MIVLILVFFSISLSAQHSILSKVLERHTKNGYVRYETLKSDADLYKYIDWLRQANPDTVRNRDAALAFWINAYNAYTLKIICDAYPVSSINDLHTGGLIIGQVIGGTVWDKKLVVINNKEMTLNEIEHEILRKKYKEPRIHFALVCAARSCPPLRNEAYVAERVQQQLTEQGELFFADRSKNIFDKKNRKAKLSKILDWFDSDFGKNDAAVLLYIAAFLPDELAGEIRINFAKWEIDYLPYDWSLNNIK